LSPLRKITQVEPGSAIPAHNLLIFILFLNMKITVVMKGKKKVIKIGDKSKVIDVIKKIKLNPETVIVKRGQEILLETDDLKPNDKIEFIKIVSGG